MRFPGEHMSSKFVWGARKRTISERKNKGKGMLILGWGNETGHTIRDSPPPKENGKGSQRKNVPLLEQ